jgi:hypothetical protein
LHGKTIGSYLPLLKRVPCKSGLCFDEYVGRDYNSKENSAYSEAFNVKAY